MLLCANEVSEWNWFSVGCEHRASVFAAVANYMETDEIMGGGRRNVHCLGELP